MSKLVDLYSQSKYQAYQNQAQYTQKLHGLPATTPILNQDGSISSGTQQNGAPAAPISVSAPNGKVYSFKDQASADAFKKKAGIQ